MWLSIVPGVQIVCSPEIISVLDETTMSISSITSGLPAFPTPRILPSLIPSDMTMPDGTRAPSGYLKWTKTWITHEYERPGALWGINRKNYDKINIPERAYQNNEEKIKIKALNYGANQISSINKKSSVSKIDSFSSFLRLELIKDDNCISTKDHFFTEPKDLILEKPSFNFNYKINNYYLQIFQNSKHKNKNKLILENKDLQFFQHY